MNLLDLLLAVLALGAVVNGVRLGLAARVFSWAGLLLGLLASVWTVPVALRLISGGSATVRLLLGVGVLVVTVAVIAGIGDGLGMRLRSRVADSSMRGPDRAFGGVAGLVSVVVAVWLLAPAAAEVPGAIARQVRSSTIVGAIGSNLPPPPDTVRALRTLVDESRFPEVFDDLRVAPDTGPPPGEIPVPAEVVAQATASTVNVEVDACGRRFEGSGFAVAPDTIITNAHVVAGADRVQVRRPDGQVLEGAVRTFDGARDLAVLAVPGLGQAPLAVASVPEGAPAVEIGYPGGQDEPRPAPVTVSSQRTATGRDIYGRERTEREVLFLAAQLRQGDSGAPIVDQAGQAVGAVFAVSPDRPTTAFALASTEIEAVLAAPANDVGPCM